MSKLINFEKTVISENGKTTKKVHFEVDDILIGFITIFIIGWGLFKLILWTM